MIVHFFLERPYTVSSGAQVLSVVFIYQALAFDNLSTGIVLSGIIIIVMTVSNKNAEKDNNLLLLPRPEPMPDLHAYMSERSKALAMSKSREANYNLYLKSHRKCATIDYLPIKLDIENVSRCNYRCIMCQVSDWHKGKRAKDMQFSDFKN